jgi:predicted RNA-binding protein with PIN domain
MVDIVYVADGANRANETNETDGMEETTDRILAAGGGSGLRDALLGIAQTGACVLAVLCLGLGARLWIGGDPTRPAERGWAYNLPVSSDSEETGRPTADVPLPGASARRWLVDGFNVLHVGILRGRARGAWWREEGRARLLERVASFQGPAAQVWIVFDGPRPAEAAPQDSATSPGQVVFAPSADDWLLEEVRRAEDPTTITLVTADRRLADRARHRGAAVVSPRAFLDRCSGGDEPGSGGAGQQSGSI